MPNNRRLPQNRRLPHLIEGMLKHFILGDGCLVIKRPRGRVAYLAVRREVGGGRQSRSQAQQAQHNIKHQRWNKVQLRYRCFRMVLRLIQGKGEGGQDGGLQQMSDISQIACSIEHYPMALTCLYPQNDLTLRASIRPRSSQASIARPARRWRRALRFANILQLGSTWARSLARKTA